MRPPVHRQRVRQTVRRADESGTRNGTPELSSCPKSDPSSLLLLRSAASSIVFPGSPSSSDDTYRIAPSPPALDTEAWNEDPHSPRKDGFALTHLYVGRTFPNSLVIDPFSSSRLTPRGAPTNKVASVGGIDREILEGNIWLKV